MKRWKSQKGFTLIEILIVVAIIGIIAAIGIPNLLDAIDRSKQRAAVADMRAWGTALSSFMAEKGFFPTQGGGINPASAIYAQLVPYAISNLNVNDYWKFPYRYTSDTTTQYTIRCTGKDGAPGAGVDPTTWRNYTLDIILEDGVFTNAPS